jgi:Subtilase family
MGLKPTHDRREMGTGALRAVLASAGVLLVLLVLPCASAGATESAVSPLPASDYEVRHVCMAPAPGYAGCLAMRLVPKTEGARARVAHPLAISSGVENGVEVEKASECAEAYSASCFSPQELQDAYFSGPSELPDAPASEPQTIALVDAYDDPNAEADLGVYDEEFHLPPCTTVNKCFEKVNQGGETGKPPSATGKKEKEEADGWALEISTDIEVAHAVCQNCRIVLVETNSAEFTDLDAGEDTAVALGATEISDSWGGEEPTIDSAAFNHPGIVITAAAGDEGYLNWTEAKEAEKSGKKYYEGADYPASSPHVVAVGGSSLTLNDDSRQSETVWNDGEGAGGGAGGGGCSSEFTAQPWQQSVPDWSAVGCEDRRAVADVSADADPKTGVAVYDSVPYPEEEKGKIVTTELGWVPIGGTSVASPIIASMFALAGGSHNVDYPSETLYSRLGSTSLYDVTQGGNGKCGDEYAACSGSLSSPLDCGKGRLICNATGGYDGPTGVGTPNGIAAFVPPVKEVEEGKGEVSSSGSPGASDTNGGGNSGAGTGQTGELSPSKAETTSGKTTIKLTAFALTPTALLALNHVRPKVSSVRFAFILSVAARVRATLAKLIRVHGHNRWVPVPGALAFSAVEGRNQQHLTSSDGLTSGRYRLTLAPQGGAARTLTFQVA